MTKRRYLPAPTQRYLMRLALANGGRYVTRHPEVLVKLRKMVRRGWFEELPNKTADGGTAFDITELGLKAFKEAHHE